MFFRHLAVVLHGLFSIESVSHQPAMSALLYLRLIGFAAGTLVHLFLVVLVAGYRRPRAFERVLFFLALTLFLFYSGALLGLNAEIYYARSPPGWDSFRRFWCISTPPTAPLLAKLVRRSG